MPVRSRQNIALLAITASYAASESVPRSEWNPPPERFARRGQPPLYSHADRALRSGGSSSTPVIDVSAHVLTAPRYAPNLKACVFFINHQLMQHRAFLQGAMQRDKRNPKFLDQINFALQSCGLKLIRPSTLPLRITRSKVLLFISGS